MLKLTTDKHEASRGLSATAELIVLSPRPRSGRHQGRHICFFRRAKLTPHVKFVLA